MLGVLERIALYFLCFDLLLTNARPSHSTRRRLGMPMSRNLQKFFSGSETNTILLSATEYLGKYGWMSPKNWSAISPRSRPTAEGQRFDNLISESQSLPEDSRNVNRENLSNGSSLDFTESPNNLDIALRHYQRANGLEMTGFLDGQTMYMMSRLRCGVPDQMRELNETTEDEFLLQEQNQQSTDQSISIGYESVSPTERKRRSITGDKNKISIFSSSLIPSGFSGDMKIGFNQFDKTSFQSYAEEGDQSQTSRFDGMSKVLDVLRKHKIANEEIQESNTLSNTSFPPSSSHPLQLVARILTEVQTTPSVGRVRRSNGFRQFPGRGAWGMAFAKKTITWRLVREWSHRNTDVMSSADVWYTLKMAFRIWSEVFPRNFQEDNSSPANDVDILIGFGTGKHNRCPVRFNSNFLTREYAHAWSLPKAEIHFNDDQPFVPVGWVSSTVPGRFHLPHRGSSSHPISLLKVAIHEIGHTLGLYHNKNRVSIMNPYYQPFQQQQTIELSNFDRENVQRLYGTCDTSFDAVFDWVRKVRAANGQLEWKYNTYFFRQHWYWLYENRVHRPRYGDPKLTAPNWRGILNTANDPHKKIDGIVHVRGWRSLEGPTFFFKGDIYMEYDPQTDKAKDTNAMGQKYPRRIAEDFQHIPYPIDTVFYKFNEDLLYFFKNNMVYRYRWKTRSYVDSGPISAVFPGWGGASPLPGNIDAAYYSYTHQAFYFFKGAYYWKLADERERRANRGIKIPYNAVGPRMKTAAKWKYICDVGSDEITTSSILG